MFGSSVDEGVARGERREFLISDYHVPAGDEDEMLDSRLTRFIHHVLKDRPVDDGQHLLGDRLGRGQKPRAETGHGQYGFTNGFVHECLVPRSRGGEERRA